jgi:hypothetical protein
MRLSSALLALVAACAVLTAQYPVGIGTDNTAAITPGVVAAYNWYTHSPSGCTNGPGLACVGTDLLGDSHFFSAWLPNSSGLPVTSGLPIVGSMNDYNFPYAGAVTATSCSCSLQCFLGVHRMRPLSQRSIACLVLELPAAHRILQQVGMEWALGAKHPLGQAGKVARLCRMGGFCISQWSGKSVAGSRLCMTPLS